MTPISFGGCFGWLHVPRQNAAVEVAVLICMPLSYDALTSYSSLRLLADQLAAAGYPTLRFDYPGTGNSCDAAVEQAGGHWIAWQRSVEDAADRLRAATGARRLVLIGLRASALLATESAARRDDIAGLVLLTPVLRGKSYIRQLAVETTIATGRDTLAGAGTGQGLVYREFNFSPETVSLIEATDLRQAKLGPGQKVAICPRQDSRLADQCVEAWRRTGAEVTTIPWKGLDPLVRQNIVEDDTLADFSSILAWLEREVRPGVSAGPSEPLSEQPFEQPVELRPSGCVETPVRFGPEARLFGMLCRPDQAVATEVLLIGNGGRDPHYGASRQNVVLARRLAREGIASFRFDFAGLGDSAGPPGREQMMTPMFTESRAADIVAALDTLEARGFRRFAMAGLCAGAYHAFVAALVDCRLSTLLLINMPFFDMPAGSAVDHLYWREMTLMQLLARLPRWQSWMKLYGLRREIGAIFLVQFLKLRGRAADRLKRFAAGARGAEPQTSAQRALASLGARGVRTFFLFSQDDHGIAAVETELRCPGTRIESEYPDVAWRVFPKMDHDLSHAAGRLDAESAMIAFITARSVTDRAGRSFHANEATA
jgi:pimeloyl-ACP methyl ester carboxylesterase